MRVDSLALFLGGLGFLVFGAVMTVAPQAAFAMVGWQIPDGMPTIEIRAFYGGLELALGVVMLAAARRPELRRQGVVLGLLCYGLVGLVRLAGILIDGVSSSFLWGALATELGLAALFAVAFFRERAP